MAEISARDWSMQYEALKKRIQNVRSNTGTFTSDEVKTIIATIGSLDSQLRTMSENPMRYELVASEIGRRQVLLESTKKLMAGGAIRENLPTSSGSVKMGGRLSIDPSKASNATSNPMVSDQALLQRQRDIMKLQDDMLLDIESGVGRLHEKALVIGDEARHHNRLLDDLDSNVDIATAALQAETKHAEQIKDKAQVCWMYICIAVEVIVLFILILLMFM